MTYSIPSLGGADAKRRSLGGRMDGNLLFGLLSSIGGGSFVAMTSYLTTRKRTNAEARKLDAEAERIQAETTKLLLEVTTSHASSVPDNSAPTGWNKHESHDGSYEVSLDSGVRYAGTSSGRINSRFHSRGFGTLMQAIKADLYLGKRLRLTGYVKTVGVNDSVGLWMRVDGPANEVLAFDNMEGRRIHGTFDWVRMQVVLDVPDQAIAIAFGLLLIGQGNAWVDDVTLATVSRRVKITGFTSTRDDDLPSKLVNPDFES